jgi:hypothetical protein
VLFEPVGADDDRFQRITLRSGAAKLDLDLHEEPDVGWIGAAGQNSPLLLAFRKSGRLVMVSHRRGRLGLSARRSEGRRQVQEFFESCHS